MLGNILQSVMKLKHFHMKRVLHPINVRHVMQCNYGNVEYIMQLRLKLPGASVIKKKYISFS